MSPTGKLEWHRTNKKDTTSTSYTGWFLVSIDENNGERPWEICQQVYVLICLQIVSKMSVLKSLGRLSPIPMETPHMGI
jgi:hypothetical protein